jgi:hypothetical protein
MSHPGSRVALALASAFLAAATLEPGPRPQAPSPLACAAQAADGQDPRPHCCLTNPRYVGTCEVEPEKDETCASILEYLNNPQSQGKSYCNRTNIRADWKLIPCEPGMKQG